MGRDGEAVAHLGPDLLDPGYDAQVALANVLADPSRTVTEALLDQRNVAGMGTIFNAEPLFVHAVNPWTPVGEVGAELVAQVLDTARRSGEKLCALVEGVVRGWNE